VPEAKCRPVIGRMQNGSERDQSAARVCPSRASRAFGRPSGARAASCGAGGTGGRAFACAPLCHAAASHSHSGDLSRRRGAPVQQRTAGPRAHPRMFGSASREPVARMLSRGRPRQHAIVSDRRWPALGCGMVEHADRFRCCRLTVCLRCCVRRMKPRVQMGVGARGAGLRFNRSPHGLSRYFMHKLARSAR
jgi:hypothetical protein